MSVDDEIVAKVELLIRRPVAEVFDAFVNPDVITKFWFNRTSGPLVADTSVTWYWDLYEASTDVRVLALEQNRRIYIEWDVDTESPSRVEWTFEDRGDDGTYVSVVNSGFDSEADDVVERVVDSTGGFALVLAAAKAYLEHGVELNIVADRF
ncbi:MAG: SRPBCC family protein [Chloroflexota bacterium]|nr:SRPBCC family protein [Chloroflexota bacterium]MDE2918462.1 SRPBCC family protein [Chloroflexota bacterium]